MFGERNGRYKRTDLHEKDGCVVKKASHGIRLRELGADVCCRIDIMELAGLDGFGGVYANAIPCLYAWD